MNTNTTIQRIESANTVPSAEALPIGTWSAGDLLTRVDERSHPMTDLKPATTREPHSEQTSRWRGPAIALGIAAAILLVVGVVGVLIAGNGDDIAPAAPTTPDSAPEVSADPVEVVREMNRRFDAADPTFAGFFDSESIDFDLVDVVRVLALDSRYWAATGMTATREYSADGAFVTVDIVATSGLDPTQRYEYTLVFRIEDGRIVEVGDFFGGMDARTADRDALADYRAWVQVNEPEKFEDLFHFGQTLATETDELLRLQQGMVAQYHEATGKG